MEPLAERTARLVARHPLPALPLGEVTHLLRLDAPGPPPDEAFLLSSLRRRPDLFRVLDPCQGVWKGLTRARRGEETHYAAYLAELGISDRWPWVVAVGTDAPDDWSADPMTPRAAFVARLRESVVALSGAVDEASVLGLTRWCRLLREHRRLLALMTTPEATVRERRETARRESPRRPS